MTALAGTSSSVGRLRVRRGLTQPEAPVCAVLQRKPYGVGDLGSLQPGICSDTHEPGIPSVAREPSYLEVEIVGEQAINPSPLPAAKFSHGGSLSKQHHLLLPLPVLFLARQESSIPEPRKFTLKVAVPQVFRKYVCTNNTD